jgi:hypothetical protein
MKCSNCFTDFDLSLHKPFSYINGETYCEQCYKQLYKKHHETTMCLECVKQYSKGINALPNKILMQEIMKRERV